MNLKSSKKVIHLRIKIDFNMHLTLYTFTNNNLFFGLYIRMVFSNGNLCLKPGLFN